MQCSAYAAGAPRTTGATSLVSQCDLAPCMRRCRAHLHRRRPAAAAATFLAAGQPCPARQLLGGARPLLALPLSQGRHGAARRVGQPGARLAAVRTRGRPLAVPCQAGGGRDVPVKFTIQRKLKFGEVLKLVGNHSNLGNWKASCIGSAGLGGGAGLLRTA